MDQILHVLHAATILLASERDDENPVPPEAEKLCQLFLSGGMSDRALARCARISPKRM